MRSILTRFGTAALGLAILSSCDDDPRPCAATIGIYTVGEPGQLELSGIFHNDESVLIRYTVGGQTQQRVGTYDPTFRTVRFTGLPSGEITWTIIVSCDKGQEEVLTFTATVK